MMDVDNVGSDLVPADNDGGEGSVYHETSRVENHSSPSSDHDVMMETNASINASDGSDNSYDQGKGIDTEDEIDDDELPMIIDEGPTQKKRGNFAVPRRKQFEGFPYNPTNPFTIQGFKGLPTENDITFSTLNRNLLDMDFPPKILPKLKIAIPKHGNGQHKVVVEDDCEPPKKEEPIQTPEDVNREKVRLAESVAPDPPVDRPVEKPLGNGTRSVLIVTPTPPKTRESREWKPSGQYFKPLNAGWIREVVYDRDQDGKYKSKPREVNYYAPCMSGGNPKRFQTLSELGSYLKSTNSEFSLANFSFRMEPMHSMNGQEIIRAIDDPSPFLQPSKPIGLPVAGTKRRHSAIDVSEPKKESSSTSNPEFSTPTEKILPKEREPKASDKGSLIFKVNKANLNTPPSSPSLSSPKVTITPAIKNTPDSAIKMQKSAPTISISPSLKPGTSIRPTSNKKSTSHSTPEGSKLNSKAYNSKILRPIKPTTQSCSIHCPKSDIQLPELTCNGCYSFFHPVCIGLEEQVDYSKYEFYCNVCSPPVEKENNRPRTKVSTAVSTAKPSPSLLIGQKPKNVVNISTSQPEPKSFPIEAKAASPNRSNRPNPPRPIETQAIVNIGGIKYLVMPKDKVNFVPSEVGKNATVLLQPTEKDGYYPSYEVVEGLDGKLILTPVNTSNGTSIQKAKISEGCFSASQIQRVSSDYFYGLLHVFQYLTVAELCKAAQVCKLWNEIAQHESLWKSASLSMCQVKDWDKFLSIMKKKNVEHLDFKRIVVDPNEESCWIERLNQNTERLKNVTKIEFQKISPSGLENFINQLYKDKGSRLRNIVSLETACHVPGEQQKALDFSVLGNVNHLEELQISSTSGPLKLTNFSQGLSIFAWKFVNTLKVLSVLNTDSLTEDHLSVISELKNLQQLEIGSCHRLSRGFLKYVAKLEKLQSLRLERATTGDELDVLSSLKDLQSLELIDNEFKPGFDEGFVLLQSVSKALLIPVYNEEPGTITRKLIDSLSNMQNIKHFYLGFTNEWLGSLEPIDPYAKGDVIPYQEDDKIVYLSLSKLSKKLQHALPIAPKVKILKMWKRATTRQKLANRKP